MTPHFNHILPSTCLTIVNGVNIILKKQMDLGKPSLLKLAIASLLAAAVLFATPAAAETYRGLTIAPEHRCSPYSSDDYPYPQSVEARIVAELGGAIYGPYTGTYFRSTRDTDIEHIVARSEAHDSGLCAATGEK